jgi:UDP-3-O-[3-hydroxymyristoyl] glucosamine N-acyltransferase
LNDSPSQVSSTAQIYPGVELGEGVWIGDYTVLGHPRESLVIAGTPELSAATKIGARTSLFPFAIVYDGASIGDDVVIEERCKIGFEAEVGDSTRVINAAILHDQARVGRRCVVGGIVCERAVVGNDSQILGKLVHSHRQPHIPWGLTEAAPQIGKRVVVAHGAVVAGGVSVGSNVYVGANAIVTRDVPDQTMVVGTNVHVPAAEWTGQTPTLDFWDWDRGTG